MLGTGKLGRRDGAEPNSRAGPSPHLQRARHSPTQRRGKSVSPIPMAIRQRQQYANYFVDYDRSHGIRFHAEQPRGYVKTTSPGPWPHMQAASPAAGSASWASPSASPDSLDVAVANNGIDYANVSPERLRFHAVNKALPALEMVIAQREKHLGKQGPLPPLGGRALAHKADDFTQRDVEKLTSACRNVEIVIESRDTKSSSQEEFCECRDEAITQVIRTAESLAAQIAEQSPNTACIVHALVQAMDCTLRSVADEGTKVTTRLFDELQAEKAYCKEVEERLFSAMKSLREIHKLESSGVARHRRNAVQESATDPASNDAGRQALRAATEFSAAQHRENAGMRQNQRPMHTNQESEGALKASPEGQLRASSSASTEPARSNAKGIEGAARSTHSPEHDNLGNPLHSGVAHAARSENNGTMSQSRENVAQASTGEAVHDVSLRTAACKPSVPAVENLFADAGWDSRPRKRDMAIQVETEDTRVSSWLRASQGHQLHSLHTRSGPRAETLQSAMSASGWRLFLSLMGCLRPSTRLFDRENEEKSEKEEIRGVSPEDDDALMQVLGVSEGLPRFLHADFVSCALFALPERRSHMCRGEVLAFLSCVCTRRLRDFVADSLDTSVHPVLHSIAALAMEVCKGCSLSTGAFVARWLADASLYRSDVHVDFALSACQSADASFMDVFDIVLVMSAHLAQVQNACDACRAESPLDCTCDEALLLQAAGEAAAQGLQCSVSEAKAVVRATFADDIEFQFIMISKIRDFVEDDASTYGNAAIISQSGLSLASLAWPELVARSQRQRAHLAASLKPFVGTAVDSGEEESAISTFRNFEITVRNSVSQVPDAIIMELFAVVRRIGSSKSVYDAVAGLSFRHAAHTVLPPWLALHNERRRSTTARDDMFAIADKILHRCASELVSQHLLRDWVGVAAAKKGRNPDPFLRFGAERTDATTEDAPRRWRRIVSELHEIIAALEQEDL